MTALIGVTVVIPLADAVEVQLAYLNNEVSGGPRPNIDISFQMLEESIAVIRTFTEAVKLVGNPLPFSSEPRSRLFDRLTDGVKGEFISSELRVMLHWTRVDENVHMKNRPPFKVDFPVWLELQKFLDDFVVLINRVRQGI